MHAARPRDMGFAIAACAGLAAYNNVISKHPWHQRRYVLLNLCATVSAWRRSRSRLSASRRF